MTSETRSWHKGDSTHGIRRVAAVAGVVVLGLTAIAASALPREIPAPTRTRVVSVADEEAIGAPRGAVAATSRVADSTTTGWDSDLEAIAAPRGPISLAASDEPNTPALNAGPLVRQLPLDPVDEANAFAAPRGHDLGVDHLRVIATGGMDGAE